MNTRFHRRAPRWRFGLPLLALAACLGFSPAHANDVAPALDTPNLAKPTLPALTAPGMALTQRSVSQSGQFVIFSPDVRLRLAVSSFAETAKRDVMEILRQRDHWKMPIVIDLRRPASTDSARPVSRVQLVQTDAGWKVDVDVVLRDSEFKQVRFPQLVIRALLLEMAYRDRPPEVGTVYAEPPSWLVEGFAQVIQRRATGAPPDAALFRQLIDTGRLPKIADFLKSNVAAMDATSLSVHGACASSLLELLIDVPGGSAALGKMVKGLSDYDGDPVAMLLKYFPMLGGNPAALEKWWTLGLARYSTLDGHVSLSISDTDARLAPLLTVTVVTDEKKKTKTDFPLTEYKAMLKHPGAKPALFTRAASLTELLLQAHPLIRPVIQEYQGITLNLAQGKTRGIEKDLAAIASYRGMIVERMDKIEDYLNWYEATQMPEKSGAFADFMQSAKAAETHPPPKRNDAISRYIDQLQREFE